MTVRRLPDTALDPTLRHEIEAIARSFRSIEDAEIAALATDIVAPIRANKTWITFCEFVTSTILECGYVVVRGLDPDEGRSLLIISTALGAVFDQYRPQRIVKRFRMSPWTNELSHTTRAGDFHTDGNVATIPPVATAMQCEHEDPGAPEYAEQRVAYLPRLLECLRFGTREDAEAFAFLTKAEAVMAHERSPDVWKGRLVQNGTIRYHPQSLRIAAKRFDEPTPRLECLIAAIHRAATHVSVPFHTSPGDAVFVSNRTALHYRGACSVRFIRFPSDFESRSLFVLHLREPTE
jgi:hypothetical protein